MTIALRIGAGYDKNKDAHDLKQRNQVSGLEDLAWVETNKSVGKGKTPCFEPHWEGPYVVYRRFPNEVTYEVHLPSQQSKFTFFK